MAPARHLVAAVAAALFAAGAAGSALGQSFSQVDRMPARVQVEGVDVEQVERLSPGVALNFSVYGTPGGSAMLRIDGARRSVDLQETQPGIYEGTYVIAPQDRIRADSRVTATVMRGNVAAHTTLEESLQLGHGGAAAFHDAAAAPAPNARLEPSVPLPAPASPAFARTTCATCGIVESIRAEQGAPGPGNLGAVSGAVIGAVLGDRAREAHMRRIARIHGTVTGALTGRSADRDGGPRYEVRFRMPDGQTQSRSYPGAPAFRVGDRVSLDSDGAADIVPGSLRP